MREPMGDIVGNVDRFYVHAKRFVWVDTAQPASEDGEIFVGSRLKVDGVVKRCEAGRYLPLGEDINYNLEASILHTIEHIGSARMSVGNAISHILVFDCKGHGIDAARDYLNGLVEGGLEEEVVVMRCVAEDTETHIRKCLWKFVHVVAERGIVELRGTTNEVVIDWRGAEFEGEVSCSHGEESEDF